MRGPHVPGRTETRPVIDAESLTRTLPPYAVILHNDDVNDMEHVVRSLLQAVPSLTTARATEIMLEAHNGGRALVVTCPLELAELYRDRLVSQRLSATIERT